MITTHSNKSDIHHYPIEQPFKLPLLLTAIAVFIPSLILYWLYGDVQSTPRSLKLFIGNWISPIILWFFCASFFHLWLKRRKLKAEQLATTALIDKIIPNAVNHVISNEVNNTIGQISESELQQRLSKLSDDSEIHDDNLLNSRLDLYLNHTDNDIDDTFAIKEREYLKGSFSLSRFMVWAIPIMGFIGTVWGISNGIAHFSDAMTSTNSVTDVSVMLKENLPLVTSSLATAFDTTLLALLLSIPLMMFMLSLEKDEEAYLIDLDEKWFHSVKPLVQANVRHASPAVPSNSVGSPAIGTDHSHIVAQEITVLSTQIKALQETMEDLHETVFSSNLGNHNQDDAQK